MAVAAQMLRPQPFPSVCASAQRQGFASPDCKTAVRP